MSLLGIDIGSGSCKGVVFDTAGEQLASETIAYSTNGNGSPFVEINASVFKDAVFSVIRKLSSQVKYDPVEALAISSHGETIIPVNSAGNSVSSAIMNSDNRAVDEASWWEENFGAQRIYEITGLPLHAMFSLNKIMWLRKHQPNIYKKANKFLSVGDYILAQLGLTPYTDYSLASRTMAFDIAKCDWSDEILNHCGVPREKLPIPLEPGAYVGKLSRSIAANLGLNEGTVVALGGHDQPCGALGAGAINNGDVYDSAGTYECMVAVSAQPMNSCSALKYSLNSYRHVVPGKFVTLAFFPAALVSSWFIDQFCYEDKFVALQNKRNLHEVLATNVLHYAAEPTGLCITPHFTGSCTPYWDVNARGVMTGFTPSITRYHIYKAIFEGIACELRVNTDALEEIVTPFKNMNISGGNSRLPFTVQLRADITGKTIHALENDESVCLGAAILAGIAIGKYKDVKDAVNKTVRVTKTYSPNIKTQKQYQKQLEQYKLLYPSLAPFREI